MTMSKSASMWQIGLMSKMKYEVIPESLNRHVFFCESVLSYILVTLGVTLDWSCMMILLAQASWQNEPIWCEQIRILSSTQCDAALLLTSVGWPKFSILDNSDFLSWKNDCWSLFSGRCTSLANGNTGTQNGPRICLTSELIIMFD